MKLKVRQELDLAVKLRGETETESGVCEGEDEGEGDA